MIPEGIEPSIFGTGIRRVAIAPWNHLLGVFVSQPQTCPSLLGFRKLKKNPKRGDTGIEPATSCTQSRNHTTRPIARSLLKNCTLGDSNPRPHRGSELESDALTNSAKGAFLPVNSPICACRRHTQGPSVGRGSKSDCRFNTRCGALKQSSGAIAQW